MNIKDASFLSKPLVYCCTNQCIGATGESACFRYFWLANSSLVLFSITKTLICLFNVLLTIRLPS